MKRSCTAFFVGLLIAVSLPGCDSSSAVKFDATDLDTAGKSIEKMTSDMTDEQRQKFVARATAVSVLLKPGTSNASPTDTVWKGIHGMTKAEIEAKAKELLPQDTAPAK